RRLPIYREPRSRSGGRSSRLQISSRSDGSTQLPIHRKDFGVPAHDRILLSEVFVICAFCLAPLVIDAWQAGARWRALMFATLIGAWLLNVVYVTTARSAVVVMLALALALGW